MKLFQIWLGSKYEPKPLPTFVTDYFLITDENVQDYLKYASDEFLDVYNTYESYHHKSDMLRMLVCNIYRDYWYVDCDAEILKDFPKPTEIVTLGCNNDIFIMSGNTEDMMEEALKFFNDETIPQNLKPTYGWLYFFVDWKYTQNITKLSTDHYNHKQF